VGEIENRFPLPRAMIYPPPGGLQLRPLQSAGCFCRRREAAPEQKEPARMKAFLSSWQFWALAAAVFAALTAIFAKIGVADVDSNLATFLRTLVVVVLLAAALGATGQIRGLDQISPRTYAFLFLSGLCTCMSWVCYFRALQLGPASRVAPIDKLSVVLVAAIGVLVLGEKLTGANWFGVILITAGVIFAALS
jgi:bacterial/archaeal transporter family protein